MVYSSCCCCFCTCLDADMDALYRFIFTFFSLIFYFVCKLFVYCTACMLLSAISFSPVYSFLAYASVCFKQGDQHFLFAIKFKFFNQFFFIFDTLIGWNETVKNSLKILLREETKSKYYSKFLCFYSKKSICV